MASLYNIARYTEIFKSIRLAIFKVSGLDAGDDPNNLARTILSIPVTNGAAIVIQFDSLDDIKYPNEKSLYIIPEDKDNPDNDNYKEYIYVDGKFELMGTEARSILDSTIDNLK